MSMIYILNGPNLNLLGEREPDIYGKDTLADIRALCEAKASEYGVSIKFQQTNHEGQLIDWIQEARLDGQAIIINPAAFSHTSIAIGDALHTFSGCIAEVHLTNIHRREAFRHHSFVSACADMVIAGCGINGYGYCFDYIMAKLKQ